MLGAAVSSKRKGALRRKVRSLRVQPRLHPAASARCVLRVEGGSLADGGSGTPCYRLDRIRNKQGVPAFCRDHFYVQKQATVEMLRIC